MLNYSIKNLPKAERPRERLFSKGPQALSNSELFSILLSSGSSKKPIQQVTAELISCYGSIKTIMELPLPKLININSIGPAKAAKIAAISELWRRMNTEMEQPDENVKVKSPSDIFEATKFLITEKGLEHLYLISLNSARMITKIDLISKGSVNETLFPIREILLKAIENSAVSIALVHNHPSGDAYPSTEDIQVTDKLSAAVEMLGLNFLDHIIITESGYCSLKSINLIKKKGGEKIV